MIPRKGLYLPPKGATTEGSKRRRLPDPWTRATKSRLRIVPKPSFWVIFQKAFNALFQIVVLLVKRSQNSAFAQKYFYEAFFLFFVFL